ATTTETGVFVINANGYFGLGSSTPAQRLSVNGTIYTTGGIQFPDGSLQIAAAAGAAAIGSGTIGQIPYYAAAGTSLTATSSLFIATSGNVGIGTTTPNWTLTSSNSTGPQLSLGDGANNSWTFRNSGATLYIATSTYSATSTTAALAFNNSTGAATFGSPATTTFTGGITSTYLNITGTSATSTFANGIQLGGGTLAITNGGTGLAQLTSGTLSASSTLSVAYGGTGATSLNNLITLGDHTTGNYVATLANAGGLTIANSGSETAGVTAALNMGNSNFWTALQSFANASSTLFSNFGTAYFGGSATTTIDSAGNLVVAGNTTLANATSTNLFSTTASSTNLFAQTSTLGTLTLGNALAVTSGGTNASSYTQGTLLSYNGTSFVSTTTIGNNQLQNSAVTVTAGSGLTGGGSVSLGGTVTLTAPWIFTPDTWSGTANQSTTTPLWLKNTMVIASTTYFTQSSTTQFTNTGNTYFTSLTSALLGTDNTGKLVSTTTIGVNLLSANTIALSDSNSTLTIGGTPATLGGTLTATLNLANSNTWTGLQKFFGSASSTLFSNTGTAYFGGTATTTIDSAGNLVVAGNTTLANATSTNLYSTTASSTNLFSQTATLGTLTLGNALAITSGGTNASSYTQGTLLSYNGTSFVSTTTIGNNQLANSAVTVTAGSGLTGGGSVSLGGTVTLTAPWIFTSDTYNGTANQSTTTPLWLKNTMVIASTTYFTQASTTQFTNTGNTYFTSLTSALLGTDNNGKLVATTSIGVNLLSANTIALSDSNSTLTIGGTPATLGGTLTATLNLANSNTWTGLQKFFGSASSTLFSNFGTAYFGGTATTTIDSAGNLVVAGNTTLANATTTNLFSTTASSTNLFSQTATLGTLTLGNALAVTSGGTGQASFGQGWLSSNGTTLSASTSPTVNYLTATSTTATSTFAAGVQSTYLNITGTSATSTFARGIDLGGGCFSVNGSCVGGVSGGTTGMLTAWTSATALTATSGPTAAFFIATSTTLASQFPYASSTAITVSGTAYFGGNLTPTSDNTSLLGTSTLRFKEGNFGPSGVNVWNVGGASYEQGSLAFSSNVLKLSTAAPGGGNFRDIQIAPGNFSGLYLNTSGQVGVGYTSFADTSIGNALLVNGRVGIGTTTPSNALSITVNGRATGDLRYGLQLVNTDSANTQATGILFAGQGGSGATNKWIIGTDINHDNSNNFFIATSSGPNASKAFVVNGEGTISLADANAPASPTNKLYSLAGNLYWNSVALNGSVVNYWTRSGANVSLSTQTDSVGVGATSTPWARLSVAGAADGTAPLFSISSSTSGFATSTVFHITSDGLVGVGTTTPGSLFSVQGIANFTTATSTFYSGLQTTALNITSSSATSTFANGITTSGGGLGIGTSSPSGTVGIAGNLFVSNANASSTFTGNVEVLGGLKVGTGSIYLNGSATSTFSSGVQMIALNITTGTSTFANGITLTGGCILVNGSCLGASTDTVVRFSSIQTFSASTSDQTYTTPANTAYIAVEMWGGGGGGGGGNGGGGSGTSGGTGGTTCFGINATACTTPLLSASGGAGSGGTAGTGSSGDVNLKGQVGNVNPSTDASGGTGGLTPRANLLNTPSGSGGCTSGTSGTSGAGGGGGGGGSSVGNGSGGDGGSGSGYSTKSIATPASTYKYTVGGGGVAGAGGPHNLPDTGAGCDGGTGGIGSIIVYEYKTVTSGTDLAENYPVTDPSISASEIVSFDKTNPIGVKRAVKGDESPMAGIISTQPGLLLTDNQDALGQRPVALSGRVPTKVNMENGSIAIGDRIALSSEAGVGMKANMFDESVGTALESATQDDTIQVFMNLQPGIDVQAIGKALITPIATTTPDTFDFVGSLIDAIAARFGTTTVTNVALTNSSSTVTDLLTAGSITSLLNTSATTTTNVLCFGGDCRSSWFTPSEVEGLLASTTDLSNYLTISGGNDLVAGLVSTSTLASFATSGALAEAGYALRSDLPDFSTLVSTSTLASTLGSYAKLSDLSGYLKTSDLSDYISTSTLASTLGSYFLRSDLASLVSTTTLASTLAPLEASLLSLSNGVPSASLTGTMTGSILPDTDNTYALGSPTNRLSNVYAQNINAGDLTFTETTSAISGDTLAVGDMVSLYVTSISGSTHTIPINLRTAINSNSWGANSIFFNTTGGFGLGIASTTALRAKLDVEGAIASGDSRYLTLANTSGANGNAAIPYSFTIPSTSGDLNISSNDNNGALINDSYSAWNIKLGGQSDAFAIQRSPTGTLSYANFFNIKNNGNVGIGTSSPYAMLSVAGQVVGTYFTATSTSQANTFPYASTTALTASGNAYLGTTTITNLAVSNTSTSTFAGGLQSTYLNITGTLATSTFANGITTSGGGLGIGTSTPAGTVGINGNLFVSNANASSTFTGNVEVLGGLKIGTGSIYLNGSATSTYSSGLQASALNITGTSATSTFARGIDLAGGCFSINGTCVGGGGTDTVVRLGSIQTFSASSTNLTYTTPASTSYIVVEVWGSGGGGGGGGDGASQGGGGGGAGGYSMKFITSPASTYKYTITDGGTGGQNGANGSAGGTSCFGTNATACTTPLLSATGGALGSGTAGAGGAGGAGFSGDVNMTGQGGIGGGNRGGTGGSAPRGGGGGVGGPENSVGASFGGGGGGAAAAGSATDGGNGGVGGIIVYEYKTVTSGTDLAENYPVSDPSISAGEIVSFDGVNPIFVKRAEKGEGRPLAGIISTKPGLLLDDNDDSLGERPVALAGRVPTKVSAENGPIAIGDRITLSSVPGVGMKANIFDESIGVALEPYDADPSTISGQAGVIQVFMNLQPGIDVQAIGKALIAPVATSTPNTFDFVGSLIDAIAARMGTTTVTNVALTNSSTTATDLLCLGGDCRTAWPDIATSTIDFSQYATLADFAVATSSMFDFVSRTYVTKYEFDALFATTTSLSAEVLATKAELADLTTNYGLLTTNYSTQGDTLSQLASALAGLATSTPDLSQYASQDWVSALVASSTDYALRTTNFLTGTMTGNILPDTDNLYALGSPENRLSNVYAKNINAGDLTFTETTSAISGDTLAVGDMVSLYVTSTAGSTHTIPINLRTALNSNSWGANNIFFNTTGGFGIGISSTTALRAKLDVEGAIASGDSRYLTLANTSGANGNAALPYSFTIPSTSGDLNISSNDNNGALVNSSYSAWNINLGGQSDAFAIQRSPNGTLSYANFFNIKNNGNVGIGTSSPYAMLSVAGQVVGTYFTATSTTLANTFPYASTTALTASGNAYLGTTTITNLAVSNTSTSTFAGGLQSTYLNITGTVSTSTFARGIDLSGGCFSVNGTCVGGSSVTGTTGQLTYFSDTNTAVGTSTLFVSTASNVGIGTTTPNWTLTSSNSTGPQLSLGDGSNNSWTFRNSGATLYLATSTYSATSTTAALAFNNSTGAATFGSPATSTFTGGITSTYLNITGTNATSTFARGIDIAGGCFAINGTCVGGSSLTGTTGQLAYFSGTDTGVGTSTLFISTASNVGIGTTTPGATLTIQAALNATPFIIASSTGATMLSVDTTGALSAKLKQLTADYTVDSSSASISVGDVVSYINGNAKKANAVVPGTTITAGTPVAANAVASSPVSATTLDATHFVVAYSGTSGYANAVVGTVSGTTITYGTPVALNAVASTYTSATTLDSTHFVVAYRNGSTGYANAVVSTVSGTTITAGTPVALNAVGSTLQNSNSSAVAALDSTHFVVAYRNDDTTYANAVVSSVSGTTITAGTPVALNAVASSYTATASLDATHFVVTYKGASGYANAVVSSVSGTTITAGTPAVLNAINSFYSNTASLDATHFVVAYYNATTGFGDAVISSVSGTTITAGTPVALNAVTSTSYSVNALDSTHFVVAYNGTSNYATAVVSIVSGTTFTPGTPVALNAVASGLHSVAVIDATHFVTAYQNNVTTYADAVVSSLNTVIAAGTNILGMATNATTSTNNTITVASNGIVTGLSGLTAGSTYYWNGALTTTASTNYPVGIALTTTSMLLNSGNRGASASTDQFFGDMIFANNFRITENQSLPNSLIFKNQLSRDIMSLDENGNIALSGLLTASNIGPNIFNLLGTTTIDELTASTTLTSSGQASTTPTWAGAFADASDTLKSALQEFSDAVVQVFGRAIYATAGIFEKIFSKEVHTDKLCVSDSEGETCVTRAQLDVLLASAATGAASAEGGSGETASSTVSSSTATSSDSSASSASSSAPSAGDSQVPTIAINGNNPSNITIGDTYGDLGAIITGPTESDKNLGIYTFLDGVAMDTIQLDTSVAGEHTIDYVATNSFGAATSTRTVIIEAPAEVVVEVPADTATTTDSTATTTSATSTTP
ncbi:MAG: hypothetical protein Q7S01_04560, partial [bacterium]|nr:hypothetical protein [bacterium]